MRTIEDIAVYNKKYRENNKVKFIRYHKKYRDAKKDKFMPEIHPDTDIVLKSIPNPFGTFEKAEYVIFVNKNANIPLYRFITTCRCTEDCIEIMKDKFRAAPNTGKYCSIYRIQNGVRKLIFKKII